MENVKKRKMFLLNSEVVKVNLKISYIIKLLKFMYGNEINTESK